MKPIRTFFCLFVLAILLTAAIGPAWANPVLGMHNTDLSVSSLGSAFTYQGSLTEGSSPASGSFDLKFDLYNALTEGTLIGSRNCSM